MTFALPTTTRSRDETRSHIAMAVTEMSSRITLETLDTVLRTASAAGSTRMDQTDLTGLAAITATLRHLGDNVDTILWTSRPESTIGSEQTQTTPTAHRSRSVTAVIHLFAAASEAFRHLNVHAADSATPTANPGSSCEDAVAG